MTHPFPARQCQSCRSEKGIIRFYTKLGTQSTKRLPEVFIVLLTSLLQATLQSLMTAKWISL